MRILIYNWKDVFHPAAGGAEIYTHEVAKGLVGAGHVVTHFCAAVEGRPSREIVDGVEVVREGTRVSVYAAARRFYAPGSADVVLDVVNTRPFMTPQFVLDVPVVALIFQVAREVWFYEVPAPMAIVGRWWLETRWLRAYRDVPVMTISRSSQQSLIDYGLSNVSIVPVGGPQLGVPSEKESRPTLLFIGRLASNKRPEHAIRAFERARQHMPGAQMWVVGTGPLEEKLRRRWESDSIRFFGRVDNATRNDLLSRATALVVTSVREGWGMVVTEAAAVHTPSIAYDVPGLRDSVGAVRGILVPPSVTKLAAKIEELLPAWVERPPDPAAALGTSKWDHVAAAVERQLQKAAGLEVP